MAEHFFFFWLIDTPHRFRKSSLLIQRMAFPSARIRLAKNLGRSRALLLTCYMQSVLSFWPSTIALSSPLPSRTPTIMRPLLPGSPCISQVHPHLPGQRMVNNLGTNRHIHPRFPIEMGWEEAGPWSTMVQKHREEYFQHRRKMVH